MADMTDFVSALQAPDTAGNDARILAAIAQGAIDGVLRAAPYKIDHQQTQILPGHITFTGFGCERSIFMMHDYTKPSFQFGDGSSDPNSNADGTVANIGWWRPLMPAFSRVVGDPGFTPLLVALGGIGRMKLDRVHMRNCGLGLKSVRGPDNRVPFDFDVNRMQGSGMGSMIYVQAAYGWTVSRSNHNGGWLLTPGDTVHAYHDDSAMVELAGETDGFEIDNRSNGNLNGRGLLWAHGAENITNVIIRDSWYDKVSKAGVHIHMDGGKFTNFEFEYEAWGGSPGDNVPGAASALMLESTTLDDINYGEVEIRGQNVRSALVFCADRSASGTAGRIREVDFMECASKNGARGQPGPSGYWAPMFEIGGCAGFKNTVDDSHCNVGAGGHEAFIRNHGGFDLFIGANCRTY